MRRRLAVLAAGTAVCATGLLVGPAPAASAHPLGNATVNHYDGLRLYPDHLADTAVEDIAEIPTLQRKTQIDRNGDGVVSDAERQAYAQAQCADMAGAVRLSVDGRRLDVRVESSAYEERPGAVQLKVGRLTCELTAPADLSRPAQVSVDSSWDGSGIGWHEITAVGTGVSLRASPFPATSISNELRAYPNDLLSSPLDVRSGTLSTVPGPGASTYNPVAALPGAGPFTRWLSDVSKTFDGLVGRDHLTLGVGLLAVLLSLLLGAGHAFLPGHGKTIMAAYLVGRQGRLRDVVAVGATVTITHTAGVLVLGALIGATTAFAPTAAEQVLGVVSGLLVAGVGVGLLVTAVRNRTRRTLAVAEVPAQLSQAVEQVDEVLPAVAATRSAGEPAGALLTLPVLPADASPAPGHGHGDHGHGNHGHGHGGHGHDDHGHGDHGDHGHGDHGHAHGDGDSTGHAHGDHDHGDHDSTGQAREDAASGRRQGSRGHTHGPGGHSHGPGGHSHGYGKSGLVGLGVAGGLVPSPSALLVLLAAAALGRTVFGVVLVLGYGLGMALALCCAGLLLVRLRDRLRTHDLRNGRFAALARLQSFTPLLTAGLVLVVGLGLALRAAGGQV